MTAFTNDQWQEAIVYLANNPSGGGTQYTDGGTPPTNPIGPTLIWDNSGTWFRVSTAHPLPVSSSAATDLNGTGTISAAQPVIGTPVSNATVVLALGTGQSSWKAQLLAGGGGFTSGTTIVADKSLDGAVTWYSTSFKVSGVTPPVSVTSVVGPGPLELTGNAASATHIRLRCSVLNSTETVVVVLHSSTGTGEVSIIGAVSTNTDTTIGSTTAPSRIFTIGGKTNDGTPQYQPLPMGASGRSVIIEGFTGGTGVPVTGTFWQATQPISIATMPTTPVTGTFWQSTQPVSGTFWQATQPVSIATMPSTPVTGTFWQTTQPVSQIAATAVSATLQAAATGTGVGTPMSLLGNSSIILTVSGTYTGLVMAFQGSEDGSIYSSALSATLLGTSSIVTSITANGLYECSIAGLQKLQANITAIASGSVTVTAHAVPVSYITRTINSNLFAAGSALSATNPAITQDQIRAATASGQAFSATTGKLTSPATSPQGFQLFNPASSGKNILIYSVSVAFNSGNISVLYMTTADVSTITGWTNANMTAVNSKGGGGSSVATVNYTTTALTGGLLGTSRDSFGTNNNASVDVLTNGECIFLPSAGSINGCVVYMTTQAAQNLAITFKWIEY